MKRVIVELKKPIRLSMEDVIEREAAKLPGFTIDEDYECVPVSPTEDLAASLAKAKEDVVLIRGEVEEDKEEELKKMPNVINVWTDARIEAFDEENPGGIEVESLQEVCKKSGIDLEALETEEISEELPPPFDLELASPCPPTDCKSSVAKGTISDVAKYLRCDRLWAKGIRGRGIVIGICGNGVNKSKVPAFIGGWSPTPSYTPGTAPSNSYSTMTAFDTVGICPEAKIYDIAILQSRGGISDFLSNAIKAYQWALNQYKKNKTPQILSNSWYLSQKSWAPDYATNPNHPFTRKVVEVINKGIIVIFPVGICGSVCPNMKCGSDTGPGRSIWGANGHPKVITVGLANIREEWMGFSSQGPAALDPKKPDFCAPTCFKGYTKCDCCSGPATSVCAGVIGLLKSHDPRLTQDKVKEALQKTAKNLCASGWDRNSGYGMIQGEAAFNYLFHKHIPIAHAMWTHGTSIHEEFSGRLKLTRRLGGFALFEGKPGTRNWFHFAIPTPVIVNARRLRLDSVMLMFLADPDVWVTNVHIYDGYRKIESYDGLAMRGSHWFERFDVLNKYVRWGIGISIGVKFGTKNTRHCIRFVTAGADFIKE